MTQHASSGRVDHPRPRFYLPPLRRTPGAPFMAAAALLAVACVTTPARDEAPADPAVESRLEEATGPERRLQILFDWDMRDRDARFSGRGALRLEPGPRARMDLFGPRGETLAAAILDGGDMRVVPASAAGMLPPTALLWSALGVFSPPADVPLTTTAAADGGVTLGYARDRARWRFRFENDELRSAEWTEGSGRRTVELGRAGSFGLPGEAVYRDWTEFRELTLKVTDVEEKETFEADTWMLPGDR